MEPAQPTLRCHSRERACEEIVFPVVPAKARVKNLAHPVVPAKAGTHTPCPLDMLARMGPGASAGTPKSAATLDVVPAKAGTRTPCPLDMLRRMGPGASAGTTPPKSAATLDVVPAKAGTHTPCPLDRLRRMGPGASAGTTPRLSARPTHSNQVRQVAPFEVVLLDELDLPISLPTLQLLLSSYCFNRRFINFYIYKSINTIFANEFRPASHTMLLKSEREIVRYADVESPISAAG